MSTWTLYYWTPWKLKFEPTRRNLSDCEKTKLQTRYIKHHIDPSKYYFEKEEDNAE